MLTLVSFIVAVSVLVAVHEYGHFRMALACGVKVLQFSVGLGRTLYTWRSPRTGVEYVIRILPLGGYVRMLDEREAPVPPEQRHLAFNTQPLRKRVAIVAAGPLSNLALAVVLCAATGWIGEQKALPVLSAPAQASLAYEAGIRSGDRVIAASLQGAALRPVRAYEDVNWLVLRGVVKGRDVRLELQGADGGQKREVVLPLSHLSSREPDAALMRQVGLRLPLVSAQISDVAPDSPAQQAGLKAGDVVRAIDGMPVNDWQQLTDMVQTAAGAQGTHSQEWTIERDGRHLVVQLTPELKEEKEQTRVVAGIITTNKPQTGFVRLGLVDGATWGVRRTWELSSMTLQVLGRMVIGQASLKNISGPLTIAEFSGKTASIGLVAYLSFLALVSVALGVMNLLPIPVLDGGWLMYYLWEAVTGREVTAVWIERFSRGGMAVLLLLMSVAMYNDVARLLPRMLN